MLTSKVRTLSEILLQIEDDQRSRTLLSSLVLSHLQVHYTYLRSKLLELYEWAFGRNRTVDARRSSLEEALDALNQERRRERIQCWNDVAELRREWRTWFKQHADVDQRVKLLLSGGQHGQQHDDLASGGKR